MRCAAIAGVLAVVFIGISSSHVGADDKLVASRLNDYGIIRDASLESGGGCLVPSDDVAVFIHKDRATRPQRLQRLTDGVVPSFGALVRVA